MQVNIYIDCDNTLKATEKRYGYVLQCNTKKGEQTREGFGKLAGTHHKVTLRAIIDALDRMKKKSTITIHTPNIYVVNMFDSYLPDWAAHDFKKTKIEPIANAEEWKRIWEETKKHEIKFAPGKHQFSEWILEEANRRLHQ